MQYLTQDHLGSTRVITRADGTVAERRDYEPFGADILVPGGSPRQGIGGYPGVGDVTLRFTGKERDTETGLDYFGARYMAATQGRFTSPDAPFADQDEFDPQSWNLYSYVRNNPLRFIDPNGRECVRLDNGGVGDDNQGTFCQDKSLTTTHGVTLNGTTETATFSAFGNAVLMGDIDPSGRKDRIETATEEMLNAVPAAKIGLAMAKVGVALGPIAVVIAKNRLEHVFGRHAATTTAQNVSKFAAGMGRKEIENLVNATLSNPASTVTPGTTGAVTIYELDFGVQIGTSQVGQVSTTLRVILDNATQQVRTAYPK